MSVVKGIKANGKERMWLARLLVISEDTPDSGATILNPLSAMPGGDISHRKQEEIHSFFSEKIRVAPDDVDFDTC